METISREFKEKCHRICSDYLGGIWKTITVDDILVEKFPGGFINLTVKVSLPPHLKCICEEPMQAVIKLDLGLVDGSSFRRMTENIIAVVLAEKGLAPKVFGILEDGRLDEYIESRALVNKDLTNPLIIEAIAKKLAQLHSQNIPISRDPNRFFLFMDTCIEGILNDPRNKLGNSKRNKMLSKFKAFNQHEELIWLKKIVLSAKAPIVYCHGDFQVNNILLPPGFPKQSIYVVDFDGSGYNYRGTDFASLFNSFCLYLPYPDPPYFKCDWNNFPTLNVQKFIIRIYQEELQKINNINLNKEKDEDQILRESEIFLLLFYYTWFLYSLFRKDGDKQVNKLDWLDFGQIGLTRYLELKNKFLDKELNDLKNMK